jgi:signal transduction histidine kinase
MQANEPPGGRLRVEAHTAGNRLKVQVTDSGPGIQPEHLGKVFEPFYSEGLGVGLGLPIARQLMELCGGGVEIKSQPDKGTTAVLWLPLQDTRDT